VRRSIALTTSPGTGLPSTASVRYPEIRETIGQSVPFAQAVDPRRQGRLDARGRRDCLDRPCDAIGTPLTDKRLRFLQRPDTLFQEERIAACALDQHPLERLETGVASEESDQQFSRALGSQRVQAELIVVALAPPRVLVLRSVVDEEEHGRPREALDQAVEQPLRLPVDPV